MALTTTYDPVLSRIRLAATGIGATAVKAFAWRSTNGFITFVNVRGGVDTPMSGGVFNVDDYEFPAGTTVTYQVAGYDAAGALVTSFVSAPVTQDVTSAWLKSPARPFLNQAVVIQDISDITAQARVAVHEVVGRAVGVAVSDVRAGRQFALSVKTDNEAASESMRALVAGGDPVFLQLPAAEDELVPSGYFVVGDVARELAMRRTPRRYWHLPLTEVAAPDPALVGAQVTWQTVITAYSTWNDLITAKATWNDVLNLIAPPSEVIVS